MGTSARFYANDTSWIVGKKRQQLTAFEFLFNGFSISSQSKQMEKYVLLYPSQLRYCSFRTPHYAG